MGVGMDWARELIVLDFHGHPPLSGDPLGAGYVSQPIGDAARLRAAISDAIADVDWSDPHRGRVSGAGFSLELELGSEPTLRRCLARARGDAARGLVAHLCRVHGWAVFDLAARAFVDLDERTSGPS